jgi:oxygen-independent coproporphyrinogen-3 oxidase
MNLSLYFHIPFCRQRCGYCDFVTFAGFERLIPDYMDSLKKQVMMMGNGEVVHSVYFGGGTPSLLSPQEYRLFFDVIEKNFTVESSSEITLEANPGTVNIESLSGYRKVGFNRISIGMQSARKKELQLLDRAHNPEDVRAAVENARRTGFENINLDLIFGLPGQTLKDWQFSLEAALDLKPQHLSLYSLIVEERTPLARRIQTHFLSEPDDDITAEQYEWSCDRLENAGFEHYELSNWALSSEVSDFRCRHNMQYWRLLPYLGFGCGAVGFLPASRKDSGQPSTLMHNEKFITRFIKQVNQAWNLNNKEIFLQAVSTSFEMETRLFVGFRLIHEGIDPTDFKTRFHQDVYDVFGSKLNHLIKNNLLEITPGGNIRLTRKAWLVANRVFREFANEDVE